MNFKRFPLLFILLVMLLSMLFSSVGVMADTETNLPGRKSDVGHEKEEYDWDTWRKRYDRLIGNNNHYEKRRNRKSGRSVALPKNALYDEECSSCHFLYQPWLMPARSWEAVIGGADDHFGEDLALEEAAAKEILDYLVANSTENTGVRNEWIRKIWRSLRSMTPKSLREVPYIKRKHRKIRKEVFARPSINSFSNCVACHRGADHGDYEEDNIKIPKK
ncbi:MAG: diheme cytochrome c [Thermodesulfobacteriota bacterium]